MAPYILALDQGTTSSRAIVFGKNGIPVASAQREFEQLYPSPGTVEHDPEAIWTSQISVAKKAIENAGLHSKDIAAIGIANQRETTILWDRHTGKPVSHAIVWQSRISAPICEALKNQGTELVFKKKTGLVVDPYFSGTKIRHLFDTIDGLRKRAEQGDILFGTVDSFLLWRLTGGQCHFTDISNASRTLLFNIHTLQWDTELLNLLNIPESILPEVRSNSEILGMTAAELFGTSIPVAGMAGDQQAATFGQGCFQPGNAKNTYGTGGFILLNTGAQPVPSSHGMLTTIGWKIGEEVTYCLEGSIFIAGAAVQWLRDGLGLITSSSEIESLARTVDDNGGVYFVPAFVGLGTPYWDPYARGTMIGITRDTTAGHLARATLESIAYQTRDVLAAMQRDAKGQLLELKVDGGAAANNLLMQFQSDLLNVRVLRPTVAETTALGAAYLAGLAVGLWSDLSDISQNWALDREFVPRDNKATHERHYHRWKQAVERSRSWESPS